MLLYHLIKKTMKLLRLFSCAIGAIASIGLCEGNDDVERALNAIKIKENWSISDIESIAKTLEGATPENSDDVWVSSLRFYESGDKMEVLFYQRVGKSNVGGWRVTLKLEKGVYLLDKSEWFDI